MLRLAMLLILPGIAIFAGGSGFAKAIPRDQLAEALRKNPDILIEAIKANRQQIFQIINETGIEEQARLRKEAEDAAEKLIEDAIRNPLTPAVDEQTRIRGSINAKYTLVEYADFQCPYCAASRQTVEQLRKEHGDDLRFVFKHVPLSGHPQAMRAAQWLEAIALQSHERAWTFHDILFDNQDNLGDQFFERTAKDLGVDIDQCRKDLESEPVKQRIAADLEEAKSYGFDGIPAFVLNGVPIGGAYPLAYFEAIIAKLDSSPANQNERNGTSPPAAINPGH